MQHTARRWVILALATFVLGVITMFPARTAIHWFAPDTLSVGGIDGTVWSGSIRALSAQGVNLSNLRWELAPSRLLRGQLAYRVEATPPSGFINGLVSVSPNGTLNISETRASLPLGLLAGPVNMRGLAGTANINLEKLTLKDGFPTLASGTADVTDLLVPMVHQSSIGGYRAEFFTQESGIAASIEDTDGVVDIAGSLELADDRSFVFLAQLAAKTETPANVRQQMQFLGSANERGQHELRLEGSL